MSINWFLFDLGNTVIKLAYERVLAEICRNATMERDELVELLEDAGGYRDMERGAATFADFYEFLRDRAGFRGTVGELRAIWSDFFDGTMPGIEEVLARVRERYRVAFLSNSNEVHAELIPKKFTTIFEPEDRFIFSYRFKCAKPDSEIFRRAIEVVGALPQHVVLIDDLIENVIAARGVGLRAYQYRDSMTLLRELERDELLPARPDLN